MGIADIKNRAGVEIMMNGMSVKEAMQLAVSHHGAGRLKEAAEICNEVLRIDPRRADALNLLGIIAGREGRGDEAVALIEKAIAIIPRQRAFRTNLGVALTELGRFDEAVAAFSQAVELEPGSAAVHFQFGLALAKNEMPEQAAESFRQALRIQAQYPEALYGLGNALREISDWEASVESYRSAITLRPNWVEALGNMGNSLIQLGRFDEGIEAYQQALALRSDSIEIHNNLGNAYFAAGDLDNATRYYSSARNLQPDFALAHWNMGLIHLMRGDYAQGWPLYEWRWKVPGLGFGRQQLGPMWDGSDLRGKRILIHNEQGFGDVIQFSRYVPMVLERGGRVLLFCEPLLHRLLAGQWAIEEMVNARAAPPAHDIQCPLLSLPLVFGTTLATIPNATPYIRANKFLAEKWEPRVAGAAAGRKKVGLVWAGRRLPDPLRAAVPADLSPLGEVKGVWFCSLQRGEKPGEKILQAGLDVTDWTEELSDFAETAGLIANLDLVVTVDTAIAHLAGAMGKPVWVLLKPVPDWRWMMEREDSPWYPTMRLFRQEKLGDWTTPVRRIVKELS